MAQGTTREYLDWIQNGLMKQLEDNVKALPKGFNRDRFVLNCITVIQDMLNDPKKCKSLKEVDANTIPVCFMKGAFLGLDFFNGECYAIPYGKTMKFQTDYKGEIKMAKKYSKNKIRDIFAKNVRKGDFFEESIDGGRQSIVFKPVPFSDEQIIGTFAVVLYEDGSMLYDTMSVNEINKVRNVFSKAANSSAWRDTPGEMYKKTVLRRLLKLVDIHFDTVEQLKAFEEGGDAEFNQTKLAEERRAALPDNGQPADVFGGAWKKPQAEPVPVEAEPEPVPDDYRQFEEQYSGYPDDGYMIPDDRPSFA